MLAGRYRGVLQHRQGGSSKGPQPVVWTNAVKVTVSSNSLTKTTTTAWDGGAVSIAAINGGSGYVEFTTAENNLAKICGLGYADVNQGYADPEFAFYLTNGGQAGPYESGASKGTTQAYGAGHTFRVQVANGVVTYWHDGILRYTSLSTATYPLIVDCSLYAIGATLNNVLLSRRV